MLKVLLGKNIIDKEVYWEIEKEKNPHLLVLGTSGSGKTETLRAIIHDLNVSKVPSMIIDFHSEFAGVGQNLLNMRDSGMNPLEFSKNETPESIIYEVSGIIKKIFGLGEIQEAIIRQAIKNSYLELGIDMRREGPAEKYPSFANIREQIFRLESPTNKRNIDSLMSRIEPLFELDIFQSGNQLSFTELLNGTTVVDLKNFPTETIKSVIAEFFLAKLSYYVYSLDKTKQMKMYVIVDEAHRLMYEGSPLDRFLRESRKYGVGVILASQRPTDFNETVLANAGVLLSFQCTLEKDAAFVGKQLGLDSKKIRNLIEPGVGYVKFSRGEKSERVKIIRLQDRLTDKEKTDMKSLSKITSKTSPVGKGIVPLEKKEPKEIPKIKAQEKDVDEDDFGDARKSPVYDESKKDDDLLEEDDPDEKNLETKKEKAIPEKKDIEIMSEEDERKELEERYRRREEKERAEKELEETRKYENESKFMGKGHGDKYAEVDEGMGSRVSEKKPRKTITHHVSTASRFFFYEEEDIGRDPLIRAFAISGLLIIGIWLLASLNFNAMLFFALAFLWTPFVAEVSNIKAESRKMFDILRLIFSLVLIYLFLMVI